MEYVLLNNDAKHQALVNRIFELEKQHYANVMTGEECDIVGDAQGKDACKAQIAGLELRIAHLKRRAEELENAADREQEPGSDELDSDSA